MLRFVVAQQTAAVLIDIDSRAGSTSEGVSIEWPSQSMPTIPTYVRLPWNNNPRKLPSAGNSGGTAARISVSHTGSRTAPRHQCPNADCGPGPNLHPGDTHHCADGLFARDKHLVYDSANACSLVLFLARPHAGAAGVETCIHDHAPRGRGTQAPSNPRRTSRFQKGFGKNNPNRPPLGAATPGKSCNTPCLSGYHPHPLYVVRLLGLQARAGAGALRRRSG